MLPLACETAFFSPEGVFQGYRYWAGIGVLQSCESALTHYRLVANHGSYFFFLSLSPSRKKIELLLNTSVFVIVLEVLITKYIC